MQLKPFSDEFYQLSTTAKALFLQQTAVQLENLALSFLVHNNSLEDKSFITPAIAERAVKEQQLEACSAVMWLLHGLELTIKYRKITDQMMEAYYNDDDDTDTQPINYTDDTPF